MNEEVMTILQLVREDDRYRPDAYQFVREALAYGQQSLGLGTEAESEDEDSEPGFVDDPDDYRLDRHVTGQELCQAIRRYAVEQYGMMAKVVLNSWGVFTTGDFGEIVYNLIRVGRMRKSKTDSRADFNNVYDFDEAFEHNFVITARRR